jgi:hypothetical protein
MLILKLALVVFGIILPYLPNSVGILSKLDYCMCLQFFLNLLSGSMIFKQAICVINLMIYNHVAT